MDQKRRKEDEYGWIGKTFSTGDWIAIGAAAIGIVGAYYSLDGKANNNSANIARIEKQTTEQTKELKQLLIRMDDKLDRVIEGRK